MKAAAKPNNTPSAPPTTQPASPLLNLKAGIPVALVAVASFHAAYEFPRFSYLIVVYVFCLFRLAHLQTRKQAWYIGLGIGFAVFAPQLAFFWKLFGPAALGLWYVLAFWIALFLVIGRAALIRFGPFLFACLAPFLWMGLEYFRSELYYLRFSWLNVGYAFSRADELPYMATFGVYGIGFLLMAGASIFYVMPTLRKKTRIAIALLMCGTCIYPMIQPKETPKSGRALRVAGVQMEGTSDLQIKKALDTLLEKHPETDLFVLSEYTFFSPVSEPVKSWCREHRKYLIAGAKDPLPDHKFYNTAFVIGPDGDIVFKQAKSVPVQFFDDGLPAPEQKVWNSPWGKIGICICYDDCYTRVIDKLVKLGAQAIIVPTMDSSDWGERQHQLHGLMGPMRAAEHRVPVFRLCSSGVSMICDAKGAVKATAPFPGESSEIEGSIELPPSGRIPPDRYLALLSVVLTAAVMSWMAAYTFVAWRIKRKLRKA
jgi:apolipoprotein N-acyltransferase